MSQDRADGADVLGSLPGFGGSDRADGECPRCGEGLEVATEFDDGTVDIECSDEDCGYWAHRNAEDGSPRVLGIPDNLGKVVASRTYPYTHLLYWITALAGIGLLVTWDTWTATVDPRGVAPLWACSFVALLQAIQLKPYCPDCRMEVTEPKGGSSGFCQNCGTFYEEPITWVDTDQTPIYRRLGGYVDSFVPNWLSVDGLGVTIDSARSESVVDRVVKGRERMWARLLDVGAVAFAASYVAVLAALGWLLNYVFSTPSNLGSLSESSGSGSEQEVTVEVVLAAAETALVLVGTFVVPILLAAVVTAILHELGHGIALRVHDHDIEQFEISFLGGGTTEVELSDHGDRSLRPAIHLDSAGMAMNYLTALAFVPVVSVVGVAGFLAWVDQGGVLAVIAWVPIMSLASVINLVPAGGSDGHLFQTHLAVWVSERLSRPVDPVVAYRVTGLLTKGAVVLLAVGWLI